MPPGLYECRVQPHPRFFLPAGAPHAQRLLRDSAFRRVHRWRLKNDTWMETEAARSPEIVPGGNLCNPTARGENPRLVLTFGRGHPRAQRDCRRWRDSQRGHRNDDRLMGQSFGLRHGLHPDAEWGDEPMTVLPSLTCLGGRLVDNGPIRPGRKSPDSCTWPHIRERARRSPQ